MVTSTGCEGVQTPQKSAPAVGAEWAQTILVVDDEENIRILMRDLLCAEGYKPLLASDGSEALKTALEKLPNLILLDLILPDIDGFDVCRQLKANPATANIPIIIVSGRREDADIAAGLEMGADDYVVKPVRKQVLAARIRAVLRGRSGSASEKRRLLHRHGLVIDLDLHSVTVDGEKIDLSATEFRVLEALASRPGWILSREQIIERVSGLDYPVTERAVDVQISGLRKKLGESRRLIESVRGVGYRFKE